MGKREGGQGESLTKTYVASQETQPKQRFNLPGVARRKGNFLQDLIYSVVVMQATSPIVPAPLPFLTWTPLLPTLLRTKGRVPLRWAPASTQAPCPARARICTSGWPRWAKRLGSQQQVPVTWHVGTHNRRTPLSHAGRAQRSELHDKTLCLAIRSMVATAPTEFRKV